jgi:hypothetical protein
LNRRFQLAAAALIGAALVACEHGNRSVTDASSRPGAASADPLFVEDFESGTLTAWQDGVDPARHRIIDDPVSAASGSHYLEVTYPAGRDGGWLTHFLTESSDSLYVSFAIRFPSEWQGGTKLLALYGSRTDDRWSAFGKAGRCPNGADFFAAMLVTEPTGNPGPVRFYSYYPAMAREPDGVTCWGRHGDGSEQYEPLRSLDDGAWHRVEFWVQLNTPNRADAMQSFWVDGARQGTWSHFSFRDNAMLRLNAVQLSFSITDGSRRTQKSHLDDIIVSSLPPRTPYPQ